VKYMEFSTEPAPQLDEIWAGLKSWLHNLPTTAALARGQANLDLAVANWERDLMTFAGAQGIRQSNMQDFQTRLLMLFLQRKMELPANEIKPILTAVNRNAKNPARLPTTPSTKSLMSRTGTIASVYGSVLGATPAEQAKNAEALINLIVATAAIRKMEIEQLGDERKEPEKPSEPQPAQPSAPQANPPSTPPTTTGGTLNTGWTNGDPIRLRDGTVVNPADAPYPALAAILTRAQQAEVI
jgi:hypothetical protein